MKILFVFVGKGSAYFLYTQHFKQKKAYFRVKKYVFMVKIG